MSCLIRNKIANGPVYFLLCLIVYDKKPKSEKNAKDSNVCFVQNSKMKIFSFGVMTFEPIMNKTCQAHQNDHHNLSFVKDKHSCHEKMARNCPTQVIYEFSFVSNRSLDKKIKFSHISY